MNWIKRFLCPVGFYVFHHIPKCGGTSLITVLSQWFIVIEDKRNFLGDIPPRLDIKSLDNNVCLVGHFDVNGIYIFQRYPEFLINSKYKLFTFVRDPFELKVSLHYYEKRHGVNNERTLEEALFTRPNYMAERFPCTIDNYRNVIDKYYFVGIIEHAQESIDKLADLLGKKRIELKHENQSARDLQYNYLSPELLARFRKENELDYLIYDYCYRLNRKLCAQR